MNELRLTSPVEAAEAIARGEMVVVVDDPDRENEGDLVMAAELVSAESINFMATHGRGLICIPMLRSRLTELEISAMVQNSTDPNGTAFHVSVDVTVGSTTGISATERANTIRALASSTSRPGDFTQPGHVFPLGYVDGGVLRRAGHTEASVDLAVMAGLAPAAVICEIADTDGEMARMPALIEFAARHGLLITTISDLVEYRRSQEQVVQRLSEATMPIGDALWQILGYRDVQGNEHMALVLGDVQCEPSVLVRVHSECLTGDVFASKRCDCGAQLDLALEMIAAEGRGVVVYLRGHEGRGIGLVEKIRAYRLQDGGLDTVDANLQLGHPADARDYRVGVQILSDIGVGAMRLLTNNPAKRQAIEAHGLVIDEYVPLVTRPTAENIHYLRTKQNRMGHHRLTRDPLPGSSVG
ncbi:3,4-dihydroxy-2-butanone 4-phosphate synthase [Mycobacterium sp. Root135]|uniref:bifunctional 3,4-dihydroxy-2-butanone-4-phosphate synthase/GTP cyclohydrolase II n=1 Tax=Mycobacterium sp. Root135 TaxID=1736457 RepID=UPI0006F3D1CB|nr:bifunctional 3,4-dihydroxy-2-butanone-4-phosphate synthase/GTP cyclohydrolase II [Mycobacterium sp. Root135]KQY08951.1 3,4-dihydroxy-2-butanone 4-phosphate synthase [Mycobacterium sp. Root135]